MPCMNVAVPKLSFCVCIDDVGEIKGSHGCMTPSPVLPVVSFESSPPTENNLPTSSSESGLHIHKSKVIVIHSRYFSFCSECHYFLTRRD